MTLTLLIVVGVLSVSLLVAVALSRRSVFACVTASIFALGLASFCAFGFLASFEPSDSPNWPWQLAYAVIGIAFLVAALLCLKSAWNRNKLTASTK